MNNNAEKNIINDDLKDEYYYNILGKKVSSGALVVIICWIVGVFLICGLIIFQGLMSFFRYFDQIELHWYLDWIFRKDPLNLPLNELLIGLLAITFIYAGVEVGANIVKNIDSIKGDIKRLPKKQADRLLSLVIMWTVMGFIIVIGKSNLGTRNVDYYEKFIFGGFSQSIILYALGTRSSKMFNNIKGKKDKSNDEIDKTKTILEAANIMKNGESEKVETKNNEIKEE